MQMVRKTFIQKVTFEQKAEGEELRSMDKQGDTLRRVINSDKDSEERVLRKATEPAQFGN